jgi:hypothetical protein
VRGVLVTAFVFLAVGIGVLFAFCHGNSGVQFSYPLAGAMVHLNMTTRGIPAILGLILTILGAFLLLVATLIALVSMARSNSSRGPMKRRESAFEE